MNFMHRDRWTISFLANDAKTPIGRCHIKVKDAEALLRIVTRVRGNEARVRTTIYNWDRSTERHIEFSHAERPHYGTTETRRDASVVMLRDLSGSSPDCLRAASCTASFRLS
jgi:hypothetical protein